MEKPRYAENHGVFQWLGSPAQRRRMEGRNKNTRFLDQSHADGWTTRAIDQS